MGQPVNAIEKTSPRPGVLRFEINRTLTGMGHEHYRAGTPIEGTRPPDELARRLFALGGVERVHVSSNVVTVELERGVEPAGIAEVIGDLYTYYRPGVPVPSAADFGGEVG
jgi:hypothetical protein